MRQAAKFVNRHLWVMALELDEAVRSKSGAARPLFSSRRSAARTIDGLAILIGKAFPAPSRKAPPIVTVIYELCSVLRTASPERGERPAVMDNDALGQTPFARAELDQFERW